MTDPDDHEAGFYWISINGQLAEVAQWSLEWGTWLVVGRMLPLTDEMGLDVQVLSACLAPPLKPVGDAALRFSPADQKTVSTGPAFTTPKEPITGSVAIHFTPGPNGTVRIHERYENDAGWVGQSDYLVKPGAACCGIPFNQLVAAGYGIIDEFERRPATIRTASANNNAEKAETRP